MKIAFQLLALGLLLAACSTVPGDARIRQKLVGTWKTSRGTTENRPDGSYVHKFTINAPHRGTKDLTEEGTWQVKDGYIFVTVTNEPWPNTDHSVLRLKVISVDAHALVLRDDDKHMTNELVAHRQ